jgi:hypothetical protein
VGVEGHGHDVSRLVLVLPLHALQDGVRAAVGSTRRGGGADSSVRLVLSPVVRCGLCP